MRREPAQSLPASQVEEAQQEREEGGEGEGGDKRGDRGEGGETAKGGGPDEFHDLTAEGDGWIGWLPRPEAYAVRAGRVKLQQAVLLSGYSVPISRQKELHIPPQK